MSGTYIRTKEFRERARLKSLGNQNRLGAVLSEETKKKIADGNRGKFVSLETRKKHSEATKGKSNRGAFKKGNKMRLGCKSPFLIERNKSAFMRERVTGKNNWRWKGGITPVNEKIRKSTQCKVWRKAVYERDNYTCVWCGQKGTGRNLNADHIKPFALFPELRFEIDNGRTLCVDCHKKTDTYGWKTYHKLRL
jgi:5-methylcytosine-specific restriction endonuclease McrA